MLPAIEGALVRNHHEPKAAAHELRVASREWRSVNHNGIPELSGVEVSYSLNLKGLAHKEVKLRYIIRSRRHRLPKGWWGKHLITDLTRAKTDEAVVPERFWALVPQVHGKYYLHLELLNGKGEDLIETDTEDFS